MKWLKRFFILALVLTACGQPGQNPSQDLPKPTFTIDPTLQPAAPSLPGFEDGEARPLVSVTGEDGVAADFVANEIWLATDNETELSGFLARWQGKVMSSFKPADAGVTGLSNQYLIRINAAVADTALLADDLQKLDKTSTGDHKVSSQAALNLIAASSHEAASGLNVGMNWVGSGSQDFRDSAAIEAPTGASLGGIAYARNAFFWPSHNRESGNDGVQDIGVAEAWRALDIAGKLNNRVKLAVLDMGFQPDADWPSGYFAMGNVPLVNPIGTDNLLSCSGGNECPWHGTQVVSAAMATADNNYGSAGPGGPVADAVVVFTLYDFFSSITALGEARLAGAKIANMSYGIPVPWYLGWSVLPFELTTAAFRATGTLIFASAGNEGKNVDYEGCTAFGQGCWERTWYTPCENAGVICVGGLAANSTFKASNSNYGGEQVDIFAPYTLWLGPDPESPTNTAQALNGTSFSSPFVAGVAALIWAANPNLGAGSVEDILLNTAHVNSDSRVKLHVNALAAVLAVLGNVPPSIQVFGGDVPLNVSFTLNADVDDFEDTFPCCTVTWSSDLDGALGSGRSIQHTFTTLGNRTLTITATDSSGAATTVKVIVNVVNPVPEATITKPLASEQALRTVPFLLRGRATDANEPGGEVPCRQLTWTSSVPSDPFPLSGCEVEVTFSSNGSRTLTLTATDAQGVSDTATTNLTVVDPPQNLPPTVRVTSPANNAKVFNGERLTLSSTATDPENATPLTYEWTVSLEGATPIVVGNAPSVQWTPSDSFDFSNEGNYVFQVRLNVTDPQGNKGTDFITFKMDIIN